MALKDVHDKIDDIPEQYRELYTEKGGKFELTGISGIRTSADVDRLKAALEKEKNDHKAARQKLAVWGELDHDDVIAKLDKLPELEAATKGKLDEAQIEDAVTRRVDGTLKSRMAPIERQNKQLKEQLEELTRENLGLKGEKKQRTVHDAVRKALTAAKVLPEAYEDALMVADRVFDLDPEGRILTRDQVGVPPGLDPAQWLTEIQEKRPHWWPPSTGSGATGSSRLGNGFAGGNPWSAQEWNLTKQGEYLRQYGTERAKAAAKAAGSSIGGPRPALPKK